MSELYTLSRSSDYGQSSRYSTSSNYPTNPKSDDIGTFKDSRDDLHPASLDQDGAIRSFAIAGISIPSAFILEVFLSGVNCVPSRAFQTDPSQEGGKGATLEVRKGVFNDQIVALKRIKSDFYTPKMSKKYDRALADVLFELRVLSHKPFAAHRNIPALLGFSLEQDGQIKPTPTSTNILHPVLIVEWATTDLNSYFLQNQEQTPMQCAELVADIADGLQAMHTYGLSHADLKPDNVLLYTDAASPCGLVAKLSDFGFSGSEQHQLPIGGDTPHWGAPDREYAIDNTECPGDVFSFGLVAMFVALKGNWNFRLNGAGVKDVQKRQTNIRDALHSHFSGMGDCLDGIERETWFQRWDNLLSNTVVPNSGCRLTTHELGNVRLNLTGRDPFVKQRRNVADQVLPFRGGKGWRAERSPFILWSRLAALPGYSASHNHALSIMEMLPPSVKRVIVDDIDSLELRPLTILRAQGSAGAALRVVAILFLRLLMASGSGGLHVPGEARITSTFADLSVLGVMSALFYQTYKSGIVLGGEARDKRPEVWQLAARGKTDEAILKLEQNPALIRQFHRSYTIAHQACLDGNPKLLAAILRLDDTSVELMNHFGATPLPCAAMTRSRGGTECFRLLLDAGANTAHVFVNGETALDTLYHNLLSNYLQLPANRTIIAILLGLYGLKDTIMDYYWGDTDPQDVLEELLSEEEFVKWLPNIELRLERRRYLGDQFHDALYERLEILRHHMGPCESMHSIRAGVFMLVCLAEGSIHTIICICCLALLFCAIVSWLREFASGGFRAFLGGSLSIALYLNQLAGIAHAMARGRDIGLNRRCASFNGILTLDLMLRDDYLLTLLPICLYVSESRRDKSWKRVLTELEWIRASFNIPGSVYDPSGVNRAELRKHAIVRTQSALWMHLTNVVRCTLWTHRTSTSRKFEHHLNA
ncbi:hypothetical protein ANO14919_139550 [Xylariales sp. No.14919]|nr:hypothetical protein ANO14919_139550 [Xylariales sp. No.14919]